jgi:serine/threonine protein kinase
VKALTHLQGFARALEGTPYELLGLLGEGGMGTVLDVWRGDLGRRAALKLPREGRASRELSLRLRREGRALAAVRSPHVVTLFDAGTLGDGRPYLALEHLAGTDLHATLAQDGVPPLSLALTWAIDALRGLAALHAAGIVHRDVKLANLVRDAGGRVVVIDLSTAKTAEDHLLATREGLALGTPRTMAPEQHADGLADERSDLYAMGLVLYELLTGVGPFDDTDEARVGYAHLLRAPAPPSELTPRVVPTALDALVLRALAKEPEARFGSAEEMMAALVEVRSELEPGSDVYAFTPSGTRHVTAALPTLTLAQGERWTTLVDVRGTTTSAATLRAA